MKKKFLYLFLLLLSSHIAAQNFQITQITSGDYNARNPFINHSFGGLYSTYLYFELHWDSYSNIYAVSYDSYSQMFSDTIQITSRNFNDQNPSIDFNENLIFQTNRNGNWDVAIMFNNNGTWSEIFYLTDSIEDETNPKIIYTDDFWYPDSTRILFKRKDEIVYLSHLNDTTNSYIVFQDDLEYTYSDYFGILSSNYQDYFPESGLYIIAVEIDNSGFKKLVSRFRNTNGQWEAKKVIIDTCDCSNPDWQEVDPFYPVLVYEDTLDNERRLFFIEDWGYEIVPELIDLPFKGNVFGFKSDMPDMITKSRISQKPDSYPYFYSPHTYFIENNDSSYIRLNKTDRWEYWPSDDDTLIQINIPNANSTIGALGFWLNSMVYFTVWEDSSDDNVHLFGRKQYIDIGNVNEENNMVDFILYQNYPNPFNPVTRIDYKILTASCVRFEVINVLGEKVFEQHFGSQTAGDYSINFDGKYLVSGVYVYSIFVGENRLTRKMVLLR